MGLEQQYFTDDRFAHRSHRYAVHTTAREDIVNERKRSEKGTYGKLSHFQTRITWQIQITLYVSEGGPEMAPGVRRPPSRELLCCLLVLQECQFQVLGAEHVGAFSMRLL